MAFKFSSPTLEHASDTNRPILESALVEHDKHYWCLCEYVKTELKKPKRSRRWWSGPEAIGDLLGEGHTAATVIWETYTAPCPPAPK